VMAHACAGATWHGAAVTVAATSGSVRGLRSLLCLQVASRACAAARQRAEAATGHPFLGLCACMHMPSARPAAHVPCAIACAADRVCVLVPTGLAEHRRSPGLGCMCRTTPYIVSYHSSRRSHCKLVAGCWLSLRSLFAVLRCASLLCSKLSLQGPQSLRRFHVTRACMSHCSSATCRAC
jgi:hypothetical protein